MIAAMFAVAAAWFLYKNYIDVKAVPDQVDDPFVYIPTGSTFDEVVELLKKKDFIQYESSFRQLAGYMEYQQPDMRGGRFKVKPGWTNLQLIRHLRGGEQAPVNVILTNERLLENVAAKTARFLEPDSIDFLTQFTNTDYLGEIGYSKETLMTLFIPNTYQFFWNSSPRQFLERMIREHDAFWSRENRREKAKAAGLTPKEVYTLASIVEKETLRSDEKKRMAGVYLNRLKKNMLLQADPTLVFATRDFETTQVLNRHIEFDSPYNTYKYTGLPPGPISMASISSIDAVLNAEDHDYLYFCAKGDGTGYHSFAKTLAQHNQNKLVYKRNLRERGK